ncbi:MAG: type IV conjugative transfer system protein TraV [Burkholderiales bacterium]|nr:MAG: type IV conjugative transfer system protein TraV [Burkholderiales bacterium]
MNLASFRMLGAVLSIVSFGLAGCSSLSGLDGTSSYGCKAPEGVKCLSVSGTYYNALQNNLPSQRHGSSGANEGAAAPAPAPAPSKSPSRYVPAVMSAADGVAVGASAAYVAAPLRSTPKVLRLWIKPWEDAESDLNGESLVYVQVDNGRWMVDHVQRLARQQYAPVRPMKLPTSGAQASNEPARQGAQQPADDASSLAGALRALQNRTPAAADN